jgi:acetyl-CoA acetyltransferase
VFVVGNGMTKFLRPGKHGYEYTDLANIAMKRALDDSKVSFDKEIESIFVGWVYGDSCAGQKAVYTQGMTGVPIVNVNNNCSTGSTALYLAHNSIKGGETECVMALGFEKMFTGSLKTFFDDRVNPSADIFMKNMELRGPIKGPYAPNLFGNAGREHMEKYGTKAEHFGKIAWKNHKHSVHNPYS